MKLSKKAITILLSIFAVLSVYLFVENLILTVRYIKFFVYYGLFDFLRYLILHSLTAICLLAAVFFALYYIAYIAEVESFKKVIEALLRKKENFKQKQSKKKAAKKESNRKNKIEKLQNQLDKLSNDREDESV